MVAFCSDMDPVVEGYVRIGFIALLLSAAACGSEEKLEEDRSAALGTWAAIPLDGPPAWALPPGDWWPLATDSVTRVSLDTGSVAPVPGRNSDYHVRLLYQFVEPRMLGGGLSFRVLVSEEETDCAHHTAYVRAATFYDTAGVELGRTTKQSASGPSTMVGAGGPPLCAWLERRARQRPVAAAELAAATVRREC